ncbi:MAG: pyruvate kinase [Verrucomicrobiales bacterium]|nr:pyruvate kinase [Verrucomicrobiales bacterium]
MGQNNSYFRHTKIVATLGPATDSPEILEKMILSGVDLIRLNMAHATPEWVNQRVQRIRDASRKVGRQVAVMMDVKGPEIRTAKIPEPIELIPGERFEFVTEWAVPSGNKGVSVNYPNLPEDVEAGKEILVDSGLIRLKVVTIHKDRVVCEVVIGGSLGSKRHINLPGVLIKLPALTKKDEVDLAGGVEAGIDFVALSFVRQASDIEELRAYLKSLGSKARIIAKIEDQAGVRNLEAIIKATDGVMVARGDLGIEIAYHELPLVQRQIVECCRVEGKPVIIATHLLESMIDSPIPTRAEISDVSNAIREQADAVMLSGETTTGQYPLEAIDVLNNIIDTIEPTVPNRINKDIILHQPKSKMLRSATYLAQELGEESGIVVFTRSGFLGYVLGAMRARGVRIFAFTDDEVVFRQLLFPWGVEPFLMNLNEVDPEDTILNSLEVLKDRGWVKIGETLVVITNVLAGESTIVDTLQLRLIE